MDKKLLSTLVLLALGGCSTSDDAENTPATFSGVSSAVIDINVPNSNNALTVIDEDEGEANIVSQTNTKTTYGTFSITESGAWTYELDVTNSDVTSLTSDATLTDFITITSKDGTTSVIEVTINGIAAVNTAASIGGDMTASINSDNVDDVTGSLTITDPDTDEAQVEAQTDMETTYGTFSITTTGAWTYKLNVTNAAVVSLAATATLTDSITITTADGTTGTIAVTISGVVAQNSAATFSGDLTASVTNDTTDDITGTITISDADDGESAAQIQTDVVTTYGIFSINANGEWTYSVDETNSSVAALLGENDTLTDTITVTSTDNTTTNLVITIKGAAVVSTSNGFSAAEGGNHIDGYTDAVPVVNCTQTVSSVSALEDAAEDLVAGDTLCLADGTYSGDLELRVEGMGTADKPITVAAEHPGKAIINNGEISVRIGGEHVVIQGFVFRDGETGSSIIKFEKETYCNYCRVTEVSIIDMDGGDFSSSKWVEYYGQYNRIDHSWFSGKESRGALLVLPRWIDEDTFATSGFPEDRAQIDYNYFGDRPPAFGRGYAGSSDNEYEGVRLGLSTTHSAPSFSTLENNYFERIQGEAEVISNKSADNTIRNNTIRDSNGSIVNRHGARATISNNFVFGDDNPFSGGIRLVDDGHTVVNNYVQGARYLSSNWNGGIVLTAGDGAEDTENGYQNVENVLVAHNTIVDSVNSLNVYGGKNDEAPEGVYFVNNIIADAIGPVIRTNGEDMPSSSTFAGNYVFGQGFSDNDDVTEANTSGFNYVDVMFERGADTIYRSSSNTPDIFADLNVDTGDFSLPTTDIDGQPRSGSTPSGANEDIADTASLTPLSSADVGPKGYRPTPGKVYVQSVNIANHDFDSGDLTGWTDTGGTGAAITTNDDVFSRGNSLVLDSNSAAVSQTVTVTANTNYTLSAFMKGSAKLAVTVDGQTYAAERTSSSYGFSSVSFNSGNGTSAVITASVDDMVTNKAAILNPNFDDDQDDWTVVEGTGIGQVQDSSNSSGGADGSIKFKYNSDDSGTPHDPYIAQTVTVEANTSYNLSIYNLYKSDNNDSSIVFGVSSATDISDSSSWVAQKDSVYSELKSAGNEKGDDSFYKDSLSFNSGPNTSLTVFAQFKTTTGAEIRVDEFELSYQGMPAEGTEAFFDSIRLVSHPLSPAESQSAEDD
ncbi:VCBS domain-containing protein [Psychrosphaera sp. B3R10]|uniref:chondroitinase-B domain-containing protein n=1 Tax=unclassified Psychrosphaera TaxID=2641570 RepID=UPI001C0A3158|nr:MULTISPECIES: chondroitinase-B domain-containing protein [unclassified Psychrosphaera]MBU2881712.1 VCBS domain-containing protein [Psychrosphaera sp. I2R16]MBU2990103.1 VCBS domain-containing protein [Psychrosphaera sp. B3R10]